MEGERYAATLRSFRSERVFDAVPGAAGATREPGPAVELVLDGARGELSVAADGCVRLRLGAEALPTLPEACVERGAWRPIHPLLRESPTRGFVLGAPGLRVRVEVEAKPFRLRLLDRREAAIAELGELRCGSDGAVAVALALDRADGVHGLADAAPAFDLRGHQIRLCVGDRAERFSPIRAALRRAHGGPRFAVPFLLMHRSDPAGAGCCGVLADSFGACRFDVGAARPDALEIATEGGGLDLLLLPGPRPDEVIERLTARVGRGGLPPRWALGHHLAVRVGGARALRRFARRRTTGVLSANALHIELRARRAPAFAWPARRFPDAAGLLRELAESGLRAVIRVAPAVAVNPADPIYRDGLARNVFLQRSDGRQYGVSSQGVLAALPDFNRPEVRRWWALQHRPLFEAGVEGVWNDDNACAGRARDAERLLQDHPAEPRRVPLVAVRHLYAQQHCRATRQALEEQRPERRPFLVTAGGGAGVQRYAAAVCTAGPCGWSELRASLPRLLSLSLSGVAFCGSDIGGCSGRCAPELFARWMQLGAIQPLSRSRASAAPSRGWRGIESIARDALALRSRLLPYLEALLRSAEQRGTPVWRPLFFEFPDDPEAQHIDDQLMLGPVLLAAPVLCAGERERSVYLPRGEWLGWHDDALYRGPRRVRVAAPLERLPLFARAGAVVPTLAQPHRKREAEPDADRGAVVLEVFPGADRGFDWVEDDGEAPRDRGGALARTPLRLWSHAGGRLRFELGRREGSLEIAPRPLHIRVHACPRADAVLLDGAPLAPGTGIPGWRVEDGRLLISLRDSGRGAGIEVEPAP